MMKLNAGLIALVLVGTLMPAAALAADPAEGRALAERWCASCHAVAPGEASNERAPAFESIVNENGRSDEWISTWLSTPHGMMPDLALTRQEIAALVAYFDSLRKAQ